jgi:hypothetical protein
VSYCDFLFLGADGIIYYKVPTKIDSKDYDWFKNQSGEEILWKDFLNLPEPR